MIQLPGFARLNGSARLDVAHTASMGGLTEYTIDLVAMFSPVSKQFGSLCAKYDPSASDKRYFILGYYDSGKLRFYFANTTSVNYVEFDTPIDYKRHHIRATYKSGDYARVRVDGVVVASGAALDGALPVGSTPMRVCSHSLTYQMTGEMVYYQFHNVAYDNSNLNLPMSSCLVNFDMKPVGGIVPDKSGNGNRGVIIGPYQYVPGDVDDNDWWQ